jgi:hypothetical protein
MRPHTKIVFVFMCAASVCHAGTTVFDMESRPPAGLISGSLLPPPPYDFVHDEAQVVDASMRSDLVAELEKSSKLGMEVFVAVLKDVPEVEPHQLGNELLLRWGSRDKELTALVLLLPPVSPEPFVFIYQRTTDAGLNEVYSAIGSTAIEQALAGEGVSGRLNFTVRNLMDGLLDRRRKIKPGGIQRSPVSREATSISQAPGRKETVKSPLDLLLAKITWKKLKPFVVAVGALLATVSVFFLYRWLRGFRPRYFPEVEHRRRFSAPFSGGNNAMVSIKRLKAKMYQING